jgi:polyhydroxyalkanoate synthesis regulator phasin
MTQPSGNGPMPPEDDLAAVAALDLALDELAAGDVGASPIGGEAAVLSAVAAELRAAAPPPPPGAAERGRAAFLAAAAGGRARRAPWRRSLPLRLVAVAAALVVLVALPAAARQAQPGTALWPVREVGQQVRDRLADDPVHRAGLRLDTAAEFLAAGARAGEERREDMADRAEEKIEDALEVLEDVPGARADAERARAAQLLARVEALEHQDDLGDRSGSGSGTEPGDDSSGKGGGGDDRSGGDDDPAGEDRSGRGGGGDDSGSGSGSGSGSSGSGSGSGSGRSGSGDG